NLNVERRARRLLERARGEPAEHLIPGARGLAGQAQPEVDEALACHHPDRPRSPRDGKGSDAIFREELAGLNVERKHGPTSNPSTSNLSRSKDYHPMSLDVKRLDLEQSAHGTHRRSPEGPRRSLPRVDQGRAAPPRP